MAEYLVHDSVAINAPAHPMIAIENLTPTAMEILQAAPSHDYAKLISANHEVQVDAIRRIIER